MTAPPELAVTLVNLGDPAKPTTQSGVAGSLAEALRSRGVSVSTAGALTGRFDFRAYWKVMRWPGGARLLRGSSAVRLMSRRLGHRLDPKGGLPILVSSDLLLPRDREFATWDDQTILQRRRAGLIDNWGQRNLEQAIARQADQCRRAKTCFVATKWTARSVIDDYGVDPERVVVVGRASNLSLSPAQRDWSHPRFLFPCSDWAGKNGARVIEAFTKLRAQVPQATLTVIGRHPPINLENVIEVGWLSLADPPQRSLLEEAYAKSTCLLIPSLQEATGISAIEAGRSGIPSIGTINGGCSEVIGPGGTTVDPLDVDAITAAMLRFSDPAEARRIGMLAADHTAPMTWDSIAEKVIEALA